MSKTIEMLEECYRKSNELEDGFYPPDDAENDPVWKAVPALLRVAKAAQARMDAKEGAWLELRDALAALEDVK